MSLAIVKHMWEVIVSSTECFILDHATSATKLISVTIARLGSTIKKLKKKITRRLVKQNNTKKNKQKKNLQL